MICVYSRDKTFLFNWLLFHCVGEVEVLASKAAVVESAKREKTLKLNDFQLCFTLQKRNNTNSLKVTLEVVFQTLF